jgi:2-polyprenyl-3-methyl-5-hydroxy-6-metoxy-1,4-benzoquinol methylase
MTAACPICKQADHSTFFMCKDGYALYRCSECQHIFVWPIPTIEKLKHIYSFANSYQVQSRVIYDENTVILEKNRESLRQIEKCCPRRGRLLDIGCSSGKLLWLAKQNGWSAYGVELNKDTAQIAQDNGIEVFVGELAAANYPLSSFEAIHAGDLIEHVQDPAELLSRISAFLRPDGVIVLVTPNHEALFPLLTYWLYRLFKVPWSHPTPPYHLNQFSEKSLDKLMQKLNLRVIDRQYRGCELRYELGETHVLKSFRQALRERRVGLAAGRLLFAVFTAGAYAVVYGIDRCCIWKKKDFEMRFVVKKASSYGRTAVDGSTAQVERHTTGAVR